MRRCLCAIALLALSVSCDGNGAAPTAPTSAALLQPTVPACQTNNTGTITFGNRSATNTTFDVIWDNARIATVLPGQNSQGFTVAAGQHNAAFLIANTDTLACVPGTPVIAQCQSSALTCNR